MRIIQFVIVVIMVFLVYGVVVKEVVLDLVVVKIYDSGVVYEQLMVKKYVIWNCEFKVGYFNFKKWKLWGGDGVICCKNGVVVVIFGDVMNMFKCNKV